MQQIINRSRNVLLAFAFVFVTAASAQNVQISSVSLPNPNATSCTNTFIDVQALLLCINATHGGNTVTVVGSTITVDLAYSLGMICLGAIATIPHNINMGMLPAGPYSVVVNIVLNGAVVSTQTIPLTVTSCCPVVPSFTMSDDTICAGDTVTFTNTSTGSILQVWTESGNILGTASTFSQSFAAAGTYDIKLYVTDGICADSINKLLLVNDLPEVNLGNDTSLCDGDTLILDATLAGADYLWQDASMNATYFVTTAGTYSVQVTNAAGCKGSDNIVVTYQSCDSTGIGLNEIGRHTEPSIYPNPSNGNFKLDYPGLHSAQLIIEVFNMTGEVVLRTSHQMETGQNTVDIDLNNHPSGVYFLKLNDTGKLSLMKLVKE